MNTRAASLLCFCLAGVLFSGACRTVKIDVPAQTTIHPKSSLQAAKKSILPNPSKQEIPPALGGIIQSDSWVIYKDKKQEEFSGHVSYNNGAYVFNSDYALSDRAHNTFSAKGNVYLRQNNTDGSFYEATATQGTYNYKAQTGTLVGRPNHPATLVYVDAKGQRMTAHAQKVQFDLSKKIYILEKEVHLTRVTAKGTEELSSQKATFKQLQTYVLLEGNAQVTDGARTLLADTIIYDGEHDASYAYGARPLAQGTTEQGAFAVIADQVQGDSQGNVIHLDGKVQGWFVSPQLNDSKLNSKF